MAWTQLVIAGVFDIAWAVSMKYSQGFNRPIATAAMMGTGFASMYFLTMAVETIPMGTAYAVWTGIGAVGTAILGMILFAESAHWMRLLSIFVILLGIGGLRLSSR